MFKAAYKYDSDQVFVYLLYGCGMRREECIALTVFDFNATDQTVSVNRAHEFVKESPAEGPEDLERLPRATDPGQSIPGNPRICGVAQEFRQDLSVYHSARCSCLSELLPQDVGENHRRNAGSLRRANHRAQ